MGGRYSSMQQQEPLDIGEFRKSDPSHHYDIPEVPEKRNVTDKNFLCALVLTIMFFLPFLVYTMDYSNINRFINGYDKCGNICGENNTKVVGIDCTGIDMTRETFLQYVKHSELYLERNSEFVPDKCVTDCGSDYVKIMNRCFPGQYDPKEQTIGEIFAEINRDLNRSAGLIVLMCMVGLGICIGTLMLFRYFTSIVVWVILIGSVAGVVTLTIFFWVMHSNYDSAEPGNPFLTLAIIFTIFSTVLVLVLACLFKRINLIIRLMKESIKVVFRIPLILGEPLLTFVVGTFILFVFFYFFAVMSTAGTLTQVAASVYDYEPNALMVFTWFFAAFLLIWLNQFIVGCQHMVISGAVSTAYFTRDSHVLNSPIYFSFYNLIMYHLGTVAFGSFIITVFAVIKALIKSLVNNRQARALIDCCLSGVEDFLKYLSKNAYIQTAMHGQSFFKSGKRAVHLLAANAISAVAVNSVGDFVLGMAKVLIVLATIGFGYLIRDTSIEYFWVAIVIAAFITALLADCAFAVFETAIDTIFLCFCEDNLMNDGMARPYYMTVDFKKYMDDAKVAFKEKK